MLDKRGLAEYDDREKDRRRSTGFLGKPAPKQRSSYSLDPLMAGGFTLDLEWTLVAV